MVYILMALIAVLTPGEREQLIHKRAKARHEARQRELHPEAFKAQDELERQRDAQARRVLDAIVQELNAHPDEYRDLLQPQQPEQQPKKRRPQPAKKPAKDL